MTDRELFTGAWRLVSFETTIGESDVVSPMGANPSGQLMYSDSGQYSGQVYSPERPKLDRRGAAAPITGGDDAAIRDAYAGAMCYFGSFELDESTKTIYHRIEAAMYPSWEEQVFYRQYAFDADGATLYLHPPLRTVDGVEHKPVLRWARVTRSS